MQRTRTSFKMRKHYIHYPKKDFSLMECINIMVTKWICNLKKLTWTTQRNTKKQEKRNCNEAFGFACQRWLPTLLKTQNKSNLFSLTFSPLSFLSKWPTNGFSLFLFFLPKLKPTQRPKLHSFFSLQWLAFLSVFSFCSPSWRGGTTTFL